jgi:hypothetical protein
MVAVQVCYTHCVAQGNSLAIVCAMRTKDLTGWHDLSGLEERSDDAISWW